MTDDKISDEHSTNAHDDTTSEKSSVDATTAFSRRNLLRGFALTGMSGVSWNAMSRQVTASSPSKSEKLDKVPPGADGDDSILLQNDSYQIDLGETESGTWIWPIKKDDRQSTTLFHEFFALQADGGNVIPSYNPDEIIERFPDQGQPGEKYSCVVRYTVGGSELLVKRTVQMDESEPTFTLKYDIRNIGSKTIDTLNFYEHADFDNGSTDFTDDVGYYQSSPEFVYTTDEGEYGGFSGNQPSVNHHIGEYPAYGELLNGNLNNQSKFPETGSDDPVCILQWDLGTVEPDGTTSITLQFGGAFSKGTLERNIEEPEEIDTEPPSTDIELLNVERPPTAVKIDDTAPFEVIVESNGTPVEDISLSSTATVKWRGVIYKDIEIDVEKKSEDGKIIFQGELPPADSLSISSEGLEYALEIVVTADDDVVGDPIEASTFAFQKVDSVFGIAAKPNDVTTSPVNPGQSLPEALREQSEYLNRYYASGLGSMGAHGFAFDWLNVENPSVLDSDDFLELNHGFAHYDDGGGSWNNSKRFVQESLDLAASKVDVDYDEYDTAIVTNGPYQNTRHVFSRSFWLGSPLPKLHLPVINKSIDLGEATEMQPFDTTGGTIAGIYAPLDEDTWAHEFGHSLGPGEQVGFPDLYEISDPFQNFGNVRDWGLMGGRGGKVVTSFCRTLGSDPFSPTNGWVTADGNAHILDDIEVSLPDLTQMKIGDEADYVISAWAYVNIDVGFHIPEVETDWQMGIFSLEGRPSGSAGFENVDGDEPLLSPAVDNGVALYEFGILDLDVDVGGVKEIFDDITSGEIPDIEIEDADAVDIDYVPKPGHDDDRPTLLNENETYYHDAAATTFEMTDTLGGSPASVKLSRDTGTLGDSVSFVINILGGLEDYVSGLMSAPEEPLPGLDVIAETTDGRRVGFDPDTGDLINEIDGARVSGTVSRPRVTVPAEEDIEFTVSADRLNETLHERGIEPPESIEYERKLVIDQNLTIENRDGFPFFDGRVAITGETSTGAADTGVLNTDVDIKPPRLNASSNGKFVTVRLGFDPAVDLSDVQPASIVMNGVQAIHDEQYGFVNDPPVEVRDDRKYLMVKFPREEVIETLGVGEATPQIIGSVPDGFFRGRGSVTVFEPGSGNNGNGQGRGNGSGRKNGNSGNGKR